jgi:four helix bundle protein
MADGRWPMADGRWPMGDGRWPMADGRWADGPMGRWAMGDGPMGDGRWAMNAAGGGRSLAIELLYRFPQRFQLNGLAAIRAVVAYLEAFGRCRKADLMSGLKNYKELDAWQLAMTLVETTYKLTRVLPDTERYGLISQMQRSAVSIPSNIAEGEGRGLAKMGLYFIRVAIGSAAELDTQVELARRLKFVTAETTRELESQLHRVRQMLYGLRREHERRLLTVGATVLSLFLVLRATGLFA